MKRDYKKEAIIAFGLASLAVMCAAGIFIYDEQRELSVKVTKVQNYVVTAYDNMEKMAQHLDAYKYDSNSMSEYMFDVHKIMVQMAKHVDTNTKMSINTFKHLIKPKPALRIQCQVNNTVVLGQLRKLEARTHVILRNQLIHRDLLDHILGELSDLRRYTVMVPILGKEEEK